jgi:hypothetical protein
MVLTTFSLNLSIWWIVSLVVTPVYIRLQLLCTKNSDFIFRKVSKVGRIIESIVCQDVTNGYGAKKKGL